MPDQGQGRMTRARLEEVEGVPDTHKTGFRSNRDDARARAFLALAASLRDAVALLERVAEDPSPNIEAGSAIDTFLAAFGQGAVA